MARSTDKSGKNWEEYDAQRIASAIEEIRASENLRAFFRSILQGCGVQTTPIGDTDNSTQFMCGRHQVGLDIIETFNSHDIELYPELYLEDLRETHERKNGGSYDTE